MKKILIIGVMLMGVVTQAEEPVDSVYGPAAPTASPTNIGNVNQSPTSVYDSKAGDASEWLYGPAPVNQSGTNMGNSNQNPNSVYDSKLGDPAKWKYTDPTTYDKSLNKNLFSNTQKEKGVPKLSLSGIVAWLLGIVGQLIYLVIALALVSFLYGILKLSFIDGQKPEAREQARKFMFWGIVSLFVMVSVWGIVQIFQFTLFGNGPLLVPKFK